MIIKEQDEQYKVIEVTNPVGYTRIVGWVCIIAFIFVIIAFPWPLIARVLSSLVVIFLILNMVQLHRATSIALDRTTQTITIKQPSLFWVDRTNVIRFSDVGSIVIAYEPEDQGEVSYDAWDVWLSTGSNKFVVAHTSNKEDMLHLADEISRFIGTELEDKSARSESSSTGFFRKVKGFFRKDD
ncbi:hypothetical protein ACFLTP_03135 [Chloroflexota bacterium]